MLLIPSDVRDQIRRHAAEEYPQECCGILLGETSPAHLHIRQALPAPNTAPENRHNRYLIDPRAILHADITARAAHLDIVGFYHSHPDHPAVPSATDLSLAWPDYVYLIAAITKDGVLDLRASATPRARPAHARDFAGINPRSAENSRRNVILTEAHLKIADAIRYPFHGPRAWTNIALLAVCHIIPVIGPLVAMGYGVILEKELVRDINAEPPAFDFANFSKYLERGVAPFVVGLIAGVVIVPIVWILVAGGIFAVAVSKTSPAITAFAVVFLSLAFYAIILALTVITLPFTLRASLLGKIGAAFDFRWALDFIKRVGGRLVLSFLLLQLIAFPLALAGLCLLYVGIFLTASIVSLMSWHLQIQLYHLYLDRGGTPLHISDEPILPAFPVIPLSPPTHDP